MKARTGRNGIWLTSALFHGLDDFFLGCADGKCLGAKDAINLDVAGIVVLGIQRFDGFAGMQSDLDIR